MFMCWRDFVVPHTHIHTYTHTHTHAYIHTHTHTNKHQWAPECHRWKTYSYSPRMLPWARCLQAPKKNHLLLYAKGFSGFD